VRAKGASAPGCPRHLQRLRLLRPHRLRGLEGPGRGAGRKASCSSPSWWPTLESEGAKFAQKRARRLSPRSPPSSPPASSSGANPASPSAPNWTARTRIMVGTSECAFWPEIALCLLARAPARRGGRQGSTSLPTAKPGARSPSAIRSASPRLCKANGNDPARQDQTRSTLDHPRRRTTRRRPRPRWRHSEDQGRGGRARGQRGRRRTKTKLRAKGRSAQRRRHAQGPRRSGRFAR